MDTDILAPVAYFAVDFPDGRVTGEGLSKVESLVARGVISVLDLEFIAKQADGTVRKVSLDEVSETSSIDLSGWRGSYSGLLGEDDVTAVASVMEPGGVTALLVYEEVWATELLDAFVAEGAELIGSGSIDSDDLMSSLDSDSE